MTIFSELPHSEIFSLGKKFNDISSHSTGTGSLDSSELTKTTPTSSIIEIGEPDYNVQWTVLVGEELS